MARKRKTDSIILTDAQKIYIRENWDKMSIMDLTRLVFKNDKLDGHSAEARKIKEFISLEIGDDAKLETTKYEAKFKDFDLTDDQKLFLKNNASQNMNTSALEEMTINLFPETYKNKKLTYLDKEYKAVYGFVQTLDPCYIAKEDQIPEEGEYKAPTSFARLVPRVNEYVKKGDINKNENFLNKEQLKPQEEKYLKAMLGYMNVLRFRHMMDTFKKKIDRELAESTFIRFTWGKDDLEEEEVDLYIQLTGEIVESGKIQRFIEKFERELESSLDGSAEGKKMSMTLVDAIEGQRNYLKECKIRQEKLFSKLVTSRTEKLKNKIGRTAAFITFFEMWRQEQSRRPMILLAKKRQEQVKKEVERLSSMDALMAEIYGVDDSTINL